MAVSATLTHTQNFSGHWELDATKIKTPHLKSDWIRMNVSQTESELKVELIFKINESEETQTRIYDLNGKQTSLRFKENPDEIGATLTADLQSDGALILNMNRFMTDKAEKFTVEHKSVWRLIDEDSLKVTEFLNLPDGKFVDAEGVEMYFVRRS